MEGFSVGDYDIRYDVTWLCCLRFSGVLMIGINEIWSKTVSCALAARSKKHPTAPFPHVTETNE
jgi:hypothetical protein